jgi:NAD(P)-dependent dehydrogenase (short-subunit alcohol dehydrogenase family)
MPQKILEGKRAIVTGASSGMGAAIAMRFAAEGANVWSAGGGDAEGLRRTIEGCAGHGVRAGGKGYNLARTQDAAQIVRDGAEFLGGLDILVNCAGTRSFKPITEVEDEEIDFLFQVNAKAAYITSREAARIMLPQRSGRILMLGSEAAEHGTPSFSLYSCTKAVMHNLTKCLALELGPSGIRVNCLAPGVVESGRVKQRLASDPEFADNRRNKIPIRQFGNPENMAATALFLVSPENEFMNGSIVLADGGTTAA